MKNSLKVAVGISAIGYAAGLLTSGMLPAGINLMIPTMFSLAGIVLASRGRQASLPGAAFPPPAAGSQDRRPELRVQAAVPEPAPSLLEPSKEDQELDSFWKPVVDYIHVIEEMVISEGQKSNLDDEIVEKTLALLARVKRLIPQIKELNDGNLNHKIQRLIFKDLNGAINPFLKLSGEGKRQNRRLLLDGLKDINASLSMLVESIEQKDLIVLQSRIELIQKRYRSTN